MDDNTIKNNPIRESFFFPYLSIKVEVYGVKRIDEKPKVDITIPTSDLLKLLLSRNNGKRKKHEKFTKNKQLEKVA
jgi:hypothetical protein